MTHPRVDRAERTIPANAEVVFKALTDGDAVAAWLPPGNARGELHEFDPRPGQPFRMTLHFTAEDASKGKTTQDSDTIEAEFTRVEQDRLVEFAVRFVSEDPAFDGIMLMTWTLQSQGPHITNVKIEASDVPAGISAEDHAKGLAQSLENLSRWCADKG